MSMTITNIVYDEAGLPDVDTDLVPDNNVTSLPTALANQIGALNLSSQYYTGANAVTQYAELANFVSSTQAVTNYSLASDSNGTAFSTSTGVATPLYVGTNEVFLYGTSDPNVVVGRLGTGTTQNANGAIVMLIALNETKDGTGHVTGTDLGIEMFAPLVNTNPNAVDDGDTLNLSGLINLYSTYSTVTVVNFNDFSKVPSGNDNFALIGPSDNTTGADLLTTGFAGSTAGTVNVSTTGLGANAQTVDNGASLRIDVVSANAADFAKADTSPEVHNTANIAYENHVEVIAAGFQLTQNNPTLKLASLTVSAYDGAANNQGTSFVTKVFSDGSTLVTINPTQVHVTDSNGHAITGVNVTVSPDGHSVLITGVPALAHIDFTANSQFDRFIVTNTMTSATDKTTFDVGGIHVSTITGSSGSESADLGSHTIFEDGGPTLTLTAATIPTVTVDEAALGVAGAQSADFSGLFNVNYGPDGPAAASSLVYALGISATGANSGLVDTATRDGIFLFMDGSDVVGRVGSSATTANASGQVDFRISVDSTGHITFEQDHAIVHSDPNAADEPASMSSASLVTLKATAQDGDGDSASSPAANIGTAFKILDDEPQPLGAGSNVIVGNNLSASPPAPALPDTGSGAFATYNAGNDGVGSYTIVGPPDTSGNYTWAYNDATHTSITESYKGSPLFSVALNSATGAYTATMLGTLPDTELFLDANKIHAGGPNSHTLDVGTMNSNDDVLITSNPGPINASNGNVGVSNGNLDTGESLTFQLYTDISHSTLIAFHGIDIGTKSAGSATYNVTGVIDAASGGGTYTQNGIVVGKNGTIHVDAGNLFLDSITVTDTNGNAIKVGLSTIGLLLPPADAGFQFTAQLTDGDGDHVSSPFNVFIDGNNDGMVDTVHTLFPA